MGTEVSQAHFSRSDFKRFQQQLQLETDYLIEQLSLNQFSNHPPVAGFEIEACLVNSQAQPSPVNTAFLEQVNHDLFTPELAKFNIELNTTPQPLGQHVFETFDNEIRQLLNTANGTAHDLDAQLLLTGVLPTLTTDHFCIENMSDMKRYHALNEQILKARNGAPLSLDIQGYEHLKMQHNSVMMESTTTSIQLHLQAPIKQAHHYYNASIIASAPVMALSGNAPYLFGKQLWHETRIPLFEQSIHLGNTPQRVTFGTGYVNHIQECFIENTALYPVILPMLLEEPVEAFAHLSLHNGVIWRWNRPLVGFDPDDNPHIRIEHRVMPAGPAVTDMIANAAFYYGLTQYFAQYLQDHSNPIPFNDAKDNFYLAAKLGLQTQFNWSNQKVAVPQLILNDLMPLARKGLQQLQIDKDSIDYYLATIEARVKQGQTGATWQIDHVRKTGCSMQQLTQDYFELQKQGQAVHTWSH